MCLPREISKESKKFSALKMFSNLFAAMCPPKQNEEFAVTSIS
jgi:hypothetical protein